MKFTIAYRPEEGPDAAAALAALRRLHPGARVHKNDAHPPFKHIYLTTKTPGKCGNSKERPCDTPHSVV